MKKLFLLLIAIIMLTGCEVEYNLTIEEDNLYEQTNFHVSSDEYASDDRIKTLYDYPHSIFIDEFVEEENFDDETGITANENFTYYDKNILTVSNGYNIQYKANYEKSNYKKSRMLNTAFTNNNISFDNNEGFLIARDLVLFDNYKSYNIEKLTINIEINNNYIVSSNNADSVNNNIYTWTFYDDNQTDKDIILEFTKRKVTEPTPDDSDDIGSDDNPNKNQNKYGILIFLAIIILIILIGYIMFNKMKEKNNRMDD